MQEIPARYLFGVSPGTLDSCLALFYGYDIENGIIIGEEAKEYFESTPNFV